MRKASVSVNAADILRLLPDEERTTLRVLSGRRIDSIFKNQWAISTLLSHRLLQVENGFLRITPLGEETVKLLPPSEEPRG